MTQALKDIGKYCDDYDIKITKLDSIKLLVFALPYIKERDLAMKLRSLVILLSPKSPPELRKCLIIFLTCSSNLSLSTCILVLYKGIPNKKRLGKFSRRLVLKFLKSL
jgi:hypothetical protein